MSKFNTQNLKRIENLVRKLLNINTEEKINEKISKNSFIEYIHMSILMQNLNNQSCFL